MSNNCFSNWGILCQKERLKQELQTKQCLADTQQRLAIINTSRSSPKRALIDASRAADCQGAFPALSTPKTLLTVSFLTEEQVMLYLVTEKIK